ncbi:hypothetical protein mRhiFer1_008772 [Rhinolophus ferrumequinum]|uniref:Uncharacterized protein n=1 Tax=Rhinolophus ferrumequinum TaxID=59479 RepID=A0A7J7TMD2_RHIFE|nr:hypothetical protein mRhiFer1_008772 [Rhinolophus ferrumequinum]
MEKGRGWESGTRLVFQLVEILLFSSLALRFRSASWPGRALTPLWKAGGRSAQHCGGCSSGMWKKRHVLLTRPHVLWIRTTPLRSNQRVPQYWERNLPYANSLLNLLQGLKKECVSLTRDPPGGNQQFRSCWLEAEGLNSDKRCARNKNVCYCP